MSAEVHFILEVISPGYGLVLDLGGGRGALRYPLEKLGYRYVNVDIRRFESGGASLFGDAHALPFKDSSFDIVVSKDTLEHFLRPCAVVKEVYRVLKDGGQFILWVPFMYPFHGDDLYRYSPLGLQHLLCNFEIMLFESPLWVFTVLGLAGIEMLKRLHLGSAERPIRQVCGWLDRRFPRRKNAPASFAAAYRIVACKRGKIEAVKAQVSSLDAIWGTLRAKVVGRKFAQDVGILTGANLIGAAMSLAQGILVARWLGPESYGVAALVMTYPGLVYTFFDARSTEASVKYLSEFHARGERDRALAMCKLGYAIDLAIASLAFLVVWVTANWAAHWVIHRPETMGLIIVYTAAFISRALVGTSSAVMATLGRFPLIAWIDMLTTFLRVALVVGLVLAGWQIAGVVYGCAGAAMATGLLYGIIAYPMIQHTWGASWFRAPWQVLRGRRREIFAFLAYNDLNALLGMIPKQVDMVVLGYFRNPMEVGFYKLAKGLAGAVGHLVGPLQSVTYPKLVRLWSVGDRQLLQQKVNRLTLQVGLPLGLAVLVSTLLVPVALPWLVGRTYRPAVAATQLLLASSAAWLTFFWVRPLFMAKGNVRQLVMLSSLVGGLSLAAYPVIVSCWGYLGLSGWGVIMQIFVIGVALFWLSRGKTGR